jgi:hypothetical protein
MQVSNLPEISSKRNKTFNFVIKDRRIYILLIRPFLRPRLLKNRLGVRETFSRESWEREGIKFTVRN